MTRAEQLIDLLNLQPHPEGGYFRETFRSELVLISPAVNEKRYAMTDIYFLLTAGQISRFHRVRHDELWNFYEGDPLRLYDYDARTQTLRTVTLGPAPQNDAYKHVICADHWQAAEPLAEYTLVGCTVAPGFDFRDFSFFDENSPDKKALLAQHPALLRFV